MNEPVEDLNRKRYRDWGSDTTKLDMPGNASRREKGDTTALAPLAQKNHHVKRNAARKAKHGFHGQNTTVCPQREGHQAGLFGRQRTIRPVDSQRRVPFRSVKYEQRGKATFCPVVSFHDRAHSLDQISHPFPPPVALTVLCRVDDGTMKFMRQLTKPGTLTYRPVSVVWR